MIKFFNNGRTSKRFLPTILFLAIIFSFVVHAKEIISFNEGNGGYIKSVNTNKAIYSAGDSVVFTVVLNGNVQGTLLNVKYLYLADSISSSTITTGPSDTTVWSWKAPDSDFKGYLADIVLTKNGLPIDRAAIGIDVSSDWARFPRYGFISDYSSISRDSINSVVKRLNRYHLNGLQFYDWQYKHNMPLKGTPGNVASSWPDIANRTIYLSTVMGYINEAHQFGMKAMAYNLLYGAYSNAYMDGVKDQWGLYKDKNHTERYGYTLPQGWAADLYFMNPADTAWQEYILNQEEKVYQALPFDGWHVDQVGDPSMPIYDYYGKGVVVQNGFLPFLNRAEGFLKVPLVMNAVNQYGQTQIAQAPVKFLYTEVWGPNDTYSDLINIINKNSQYSGGKLNTILAAYMDYDLANNPGVFSTPGVLLTDAVIFAGGGSHIELGEHMLGKEYFPNNNLKMPELLKSELIHYYDFLTAYENLLRDSLTFLSIDIQSIGTERISTTQKDGFIWTFAKAKGNRQVIHLINFLSANSQQWRDKDGTQPEPSEVRDLAVKFTASSEIDKIWLASPDTNSGAPISLSFSQTNNVVEFTLPFLKYWDMIVVETAGGTTSTGFNKTSEPTGYSLGQNYPNPFNPDTVIPFSVPRKGIASLAVYNVLGEEIFKKDYICGSGRNEIVFNGAGFNSGVYFYKISSNDFSSTKKMCLLK